MSDPSAAITAQARDERIAAIREKAAEILKVRRSIGVLTTLDVDGRDPEREAPLDHAWLKLLPELCEQDIPYLLDLLATVASEERELPYTADELETLAYRLERPHSKHVAQRAVEVLRDLAMALRAPDGRT